MNLQDASVTFKDQLFFRTSLGICSQQIVSFDKLANIKGKICICMFMIRLLDAKEGRTAKYSNLQWKIWIKQLELSYSDKLSSNGKIYIFKGYC